MSVSGVGGPIPSYNSNIGGVNSNSSNPIISKHLSSAEFQNVLTSLGIKPDNVVSIKQENGVQLTNPLQDLQVISITPQIAEVLKALGLGNVELAIVVSAEDEIKNIRKKLKEIKDSSLNKDMIDKLLKQLGISQTSEAFVFTDHTGGLLIVQAGLNEISEKIDEEDDDENEEK